MAKTRSAILKMTALERRDTPSAVALGDGWADAENLTLSFAGDGARIGTVDSELHSALDKVADRDVWRREILRAFQTWAAQANINVGLVEDSKDPYGTPGEFQGDDRFGDIRVGGRPLSPDSWANAAAVDWDGGTWAGDVTFNTALPFAVNPAPGSAAADLYTIALHEAGHAFGLGHSHDPDSAMCNCYSCARAGLSATDVLAIQAAHGGPRRPDVFEGLLGNGTRATATRLAGPGNPSITADLTTAADADVYTFTVPADKDKFTVRLQTSGLSLLTARVTVTDALGRAVGSAASADPEDGDLEVKVDNAVKGGTYFVRVERATADVFGIGRYALTVAFETDHSGGKRGFVKDGGANDTPATATDLTAEGRRGGNGNGSGNAFRFRYNGVIESGADADYYRVTAPAGLPATATAALVQVRALKKDVPAPDLAAFDAAGNPLPVRVVSDNGGRVVAQVLGVRPGASYTLRLAGDGTKASAAKYRLTTDFVAPNADLPRGGDRLAAGNLSAGGTLTGTLKMASTALYQFDLGTAGLAAGVTVTLTVTDAAGKVVGVVKKTGGDDASASSFYLAAGEYKLALTLTADDKEYDGRVWIELDGEEASDPAGTYQTSTSTRTTSGTTTSSGSTTTDSKPTTSTSTTRYTF